MSILSLVRSRKKEKRKTFFLCGTPIGGILFSGHLAKAYIYHSSSLIYQYFSVDGFQSKKVDSNDLLLRFVSIALLLFLFDFEVRRFQFLFDLEVSFFQSMCVSASTKEKQDSYISSCRGSNPQPSSSTI